MQTFVRLPTEFDNLLLNAAGYFDISPKGKVHSDTPHSWSHLSKHQEAELVNFTRHMLFSSHMELKPTEGVV